MGVSYTEESPNKALSNIIGYLSLLCWIVVMFPQIYLNYKRKSGEGVSLAMMIAWVLGDIFNIVGALMQNLVLSTLIIGTYYLFVDTTLLSQTIYYRIVFKAHLATKAGDGEEEQGESEDGRRLLPVVESTQRESVAWFARCQLSDIVGVVLSLVSIGCLAVMIAALTVAPRKADDGDDITKDTLSSSETSKKQIIAQAMGMASAIVYIMSYVPQALQNHKRKSCEGLSIWLFLLSLMGNTTYALAILVVSLDPQYLAPYVPWLLGSLVPCLIHIVILYQFKIYKH
ncbi:putative vacuolar membrane transporter for cationic amino acids [Coemansia asiatica]|uniref:Vacuolar membrane transporter for cationic amino acids n=1 Tax=Coemansia asiatica TaxID=1052880 RepID=A0A9W7XP71_9FUNG|nr:putative vacuolar membrane transporter for cationic amino acids [Coemansia asiatica]